MLMKCPECDLPVSDKALSCPHCGYPLKELSNKRARRKPKRRRLPNGFGQISELKGMKLRKPFRAMVTVGKTDEGRPICKLLQPEAYFETYNDAYQALMEYNKNPYVMTNAAITVGELYNKWTENYLKYKSESKQHATKTAWRYCESVEHLKVIELRPRHIRYCMEEATQKIKGEERTASPQIKTRIKTIFNQMLDYAVSYEIVDKNYSRSFRMLPSQDDTEQKHHIPYTDEEIDLLWANINRIEGIDVILIQCYSGWRPRELESLLLENINLEERTMIGGMKTKAGKNRVVPIHPRIYDLVKKRYEESEAFGSKYLFTTVSRIRSKNPKARQYNYSDIKRDLKNIIEDLNLNNEHKAHDGRAHFITQAKKYNLDEFAIKYIVGHAITDITESVYTSRSTDWLMQEIQKIP